MGNVLHQKDTKVGTCTASADVNIPTEISWQTECQHFYSLAILLYLTINASIAT